MGISQSSDESKKEIKRYEFINHHIGHILNYYKITKHLGIGNSGTVFYATEIKTKLNRAIKEVRKSTMTAESSQSLINEIDILKSIDHPNIMKIYEVIESPYAFYLVCELLEGENLMEKILSDEGYMPDEKTIAMNMDDILYALNYCHTQDIVHNDLRPDNLLFENQYLDAKLKLIDFGNSFRIDRPDIPQTQCRQKHYRSPESFSKANEKIGTPADI